MPSPEEEEERAVFDDDDDDDDDDMDGDDSEEEEDEDYDDDVAEGVPPSAYADAAAAAAPHPAKPAEEGLIGSTPSTSSSSDRAIPNPNPPSNPNSNPTTAADPRSAPQNGAIPILPLSSAAPSTPAAAGGLFTPSASEPVTQPSEDRKPFPVAVAGGYDDSRRLFQRLWTDEEEITILQGFLEFTSRRGTTFASHQYDTGPFYEEIKKRLQLEFTKNQLIEKLRRLKKKYRNVVSRMRSTGKDFAFKSSHEKAIYDIARNIWSANVKRARESDDDDLNPPSNAYTVEVISGPDGAMDSDRRMSKSRRRFRRRRAEGATVTTTASIPATVGVPVENSVPVTQVSSSSAAAFPGIIEETVKSCLSPLFKELIYSATGGPPGRGLSGGAGLLVPGLGVAAAAPSPIAFGLGGSPASVPGSGAAVDEKWKKQQILELEVYLKRMELLRDQIKSTLEELKSSGSS